MSGNRPHLEVRPDDFRTLKMAMSGNRPETVHLPDDFRTVSGHRQFGTMKPLNVRKLSGNRPLTGRLPDRFRTLPFSMSGSRPVGPLDVDDFRT